MFPEFKLLRATGTVIVAICVVLAGCSKPPQQVINEEPAAVVLTTEQVEEAYVWALPIVAMYRYYKLMGPAVGGLNNLAHNRALSEPGQFSGGPNRDGLYSFGWFDLNDGPIVVSLPDFGDRYFVWQMTDMYGHNFANVGSHLRSGPLEKYRSGYTFAMVAPDWNGKLPEGVEEVRAPVSVINVLYRIAMKGEADYPEGHALQDATLTLPLAAWEAGKRETIAEMPSNPIREYREVLGFGQGVSGADQRNPLFFSVLADALAANAPYAEWDRAFVEEKLAAMGVVPGQPFDVDGLSAEQQAIVLDAQESGFDKVIARGDAEFGTRMNGWLLNPANHGDWKDDFYNRAYATYTGGMYPVTNNSTYSTTYNDAQNRPIDGNNTYRLRFEAEELPPATNFWSVTAYDAGTRDLYPNEARRYNYGSNNPDTVYEEDGAVEITFSHEEPSNSADINWLPIPREGSWIVVRFYAPKDSVLNGEYVLPGIELVE